MKKLNDVLDRFEEQGEGGQMSPDDLDFLSDFLATTLEKGGMTPEQAERVVKAHAMGSWSGGWDTGYDSARNFYRRNYSIKRRV